MKQYIENLSVFEARTIFKHKISMTRYVKPNYKGVKKYKAEGWKCEECQNLDSEEHLLWCKGYEEMRENLNLEQLPPENYQKKKQRKSINIMKFLFLAPESCTVPVDHFMGETEPGMEKAGVCNYKMEE